jgi:hypothetical protein
VTYAIPTIPLAANTTPPTAGPTNRPRMLFRAFRALAATRCSSPTRWGNSAFSAGAKKMLQPLIAARTAKISHSQSGEPARSNGRRSSARRRSAATMVRLRSQRSTKTPTMELKSTVGTMPAAKTAPDAAADPVTW